MEKNLTSKTLLVDQKVNFEPWVCLSVKMYIAFFSVHAFNFSLALTSLFSLLWAFIDREWTKNMVKIKYLTWHKFLQIQSRLFQTSKQYLREWFKLWATEKSVEFTWWYWNHCIYLPGSLNLSSYASNQKNLRTFSPEIAHSKWDKLHDFIEWNVSSWQSGRVGKKSV